MINGAEPETLDPALISGQPEGRIAKSLFEGLTRFDKFGVPVAGIAERWDVSADGLVYTFHLRDAQWSDGSPVTAQDFTASWRRALTPATACPYNYLLFPIKNAEAFVEGKVDFEQVGIAAPDVRTLIVTLENPTPYFPTLCAFTTLLPVPVALIEKFGDDWIKPANIVCNGAYMLDKWRINDRIRLRKNPRYWDAANVALEVVDILPITKDSVAFNFYISGAADLIMDKGVVPTAFLDILRTRRDFHSAPFLGVYFLRFNCSRPPFDDELVRKAFALAIDKKRIVEKITRAGEMPAEGFVPPGIEGYTSLEEYEMLPDPAAARKMLAEAGFPNGKGFPLTTYLFNESQQNESIAVELRDMWQKELGVNVSLVRQEWKVYLNSLSSLDYGIARSSWVGDYPDPNTFLDMFTTGNPNNRTGWSNKEYDGLIALASGKWKIGQPSPNVASGGSEDNVPFSIFNFPFDSRLAILQAAEQLLVVSQSPVVPVYYYVGIQLYDPSKFGGIEHNVLDEHPIREMYRK